MIKKYKSNFKNKKFDFNILQRIILCFSITLKSMNYENIQIIHSSKRKKTVQSKIVENVLRIYLPENLTNNEEEKWIKTMIEKNSAKRLHKEINSEKMLKKRANELNKKFFKNRLDFDIKFVSNQTSKFGSCTPKNRVIRISDKIASIPQWVQDYVIIHELAHLVHPNHSKKFWNVVNKYKYVERAKGYLIAIGMISDQQIN